MPNADDDWSDSDDDIGSDVETSVLLGVSDGAIEAPGDILDAAVSRLGGHPVRCLCIHVLLYIQIDLLHALVRLYRQICDYRLPTTNRLSCLLGNHL